MIKEYKRKKWYQWFSGKRVVHIKIIPIECMGLPEYKPAIDNSKLYYRKNEKEN